MVSEAVFTNALSIALHKKKGGRCVWSGAGNMLAYRLLTIPGPFLLAGVVFGPILVCKSNQVVVVGHPKGGVMNMSRWGTSRAVDDDPAKALRALWPGIENHIPDFGAAKD